MDYFLDKALSIEGLKVIGDRPAGEGEWVNPIHALLSGDIPERMPLLGYSSNGMAITGRAGYGRYGCHNRKPFKQTISHSQSSNVTWPWRFDTPGCQYDRKTEDERCKGCEWIGREE